MIWPTRSPARLQWTPKLVSRFWDGVAKTPLERLSFSRMAGRSLLLSVSHHLHAGDQCLDFGAGSGDLIEPILEIGCTVAALEQSGKRRHEIERRFGHRTGFTGVIGPKSRRTFDVVFVVEVLEHVLDEGLDSTLSEIARLVRPGGLVVITTPHNEDLDLGLCYCPKSNMLFHRWQHVRAFTIESLTALVVKHGFDPVVTHRLEFNPEQLEPLRGAVGDDAIRLLPDYLRDLRLDRPMRMGSEASILFLGRRPAPSEPRRSDDAPHGSTDR
jgi:2-polyprenyl-3-methyl-5-hydroxy-6-metoxy-1,4-benzoquinol methylase